MGTVTAWQAPDGTLFKSYEDFQKYESQQFANSAIMFKIDDDRTLIKTSNITEANFVMLASQNDKEIFETARKEANLDSIDDLSFGRTVQGIHSKTFNNQPYFGIFGIYSQDKINWTWYPIDIYIQMLSQDIALAEKASEEITTLFLLNNR